MKKTEFFQPYYNIMDSEIAELVKKLEAEEVKHVFRTANDVKKHSFLFDMEWDMERTYEPVVFGDKIDWGYNPGDDPEFTWQFNRHRFLLCLGQAYRISKDESYVECMIDLMNQFMDTEKDIKNKRQTTWRILEIGIRAANWIKALYLIQDSELLTEEELDKLYAFLVMHGDIIRREHNPYCYAGNWGLLENHGLCLLGALLPGKKAIEFRKQALEVMTQGLKMQILPDGIQLEQSPMYHHEVLSCMLESMHFTKLCGDRVPEEMIVQVERMLRAGIALQKPNGHQLTMGDSDDMDSRSIYALAAFLFENPVYRFIGTDCPGYENFWLLGAEGYKKYVEIPVQEPEFTTVQLYHGGHTVFRSDWSENADMLHFDGGLLGTSHGHSDTLHVDLILNGKDVLVDPGRYTYVNKPVRFQFRGTTGHNTVMIDGKEFNEWENSWVSKTVSAQSRQLMIENGNCKFTAAGHSGYTTLDNPVWINRKVIQIGEEIYILVDECYTSGEHVYTQFFHYDYKGCLSLVSNKAIYENGDAKAGFFFDEKLKTRVEKTKQSLHYNEMLDSEMIVCEGKGKGFFSMITVIVKNPEEEDYVKKLPILFFTSQMQQPDDIAEGLKIKHGKSTYDIILGHTEMKGPVSPYQIEDRMGCGNVIVFNLDDGPFDGIVLNY